jgi:solute carrier family 40 (iron-regulated transporter), member 1
MPIIGARSSDNELNELSQCSAHSPQIPIRNVENAIPFALSVPMLSGWPKHIVFVIVVLVGVAEKLSGSANMISMERDWVPAIAPDAERSHTDSSPYTLTHLNAVMRRIDLICKLFSPIVISIIISFANSVRIGAMVVGGMSLASWSLEWWCALRVWRENLQLRRPKPVIARGEVPDGVQSQQSVSSLAHRVRTWFRTYHLSITQYFCADVWMPSMALAMLHLSMLSYSAPFITHLLNAGFSLAFISAARAASSVFEVSSTVLMPYCVRSLSRSQERVIPEAEERVSSDETPLLAPQRAVSHGSGGRDPAGLERVGLWGIWGQLICLVSIMP